MQIYAKLSDCKSQKELDTDQKLQSSIMYSLIFYETSLRLICAKFNPPILSPLAYFHHLKWPIWSCMIEFIIMTMGQTGVETKETWGRFTGKSQNLFANKFLTKIQE